MFVNRFTANDKYSLLNRDNLTEPMQIQLSQKQKPFSKFFPQGPKSNLNFAHFLKTDDKASVSEFKILRLFGNTETADDKYSLLNRDNVAQPI